VLGGHTTGRSALSASRNLLVSIETGPARVH
jgi:hypothetical protein